MDPRTIEDRLRQEYFGLLPEITRTVAELEATIRYLLLPITRRIKAYERIEVSSRVKTCESAIEKLRRKHDPQFFDADQPHAYSLLSLTDLAGVRILAFPRVHMTEIDIALKESFRGWTADLAFEPGFKYFGQQRDTELIRCEYQIVPMLVGLFWEVEHAAIYKASPSLGGVADEPEVKKSQAELLEALKNFEQSFVGFVNKQPEIGPV